MKFLIPTEPDDTHAILVKIALETMGHEVRCLFMADQPTKLKNSILIENDIYLWRSTDKYHSVVDNEYDVVWWRRARKPYLPKHTTHPSDYPFVVRENNLFYESLTYNLAPKAWWINPKEAATRAQSKLLQLKVASDVGMTIPTTLCSNDPQDIRYFLLKHEADGVVYKPLCSHFWFEEQSMRISYTTKLSFLELPVNQLLQLTPGIFQKEVKKKYELRITCFGSHLIAAKLDSQAHLEGKIDWRAIPGDKLQVEPYVLPESLQQKIILFMKKMGLVFGVFDFIVNEDNEYVFLEVNEQGQFLWLEDANDAFKMLDAFVHFLVSQSITGSGGYHRAEHSIALYKQKMMHVVEQQKHRHIHLNNELAYKA